MIWDPGIVGTIPSPQLFIIWFFFNGRRNMLGCFESGKGIHFFFYLKEKYTTFMFQSILAMARLVASYLGFPSAISSNYVESGLITNNNSSTILQFNLNPNFNHLSWFRFEMKLSDEVYGDLHRNWCYVIFLNALGNYEQNFFRLWMIRPLPLLSAFPGSSHSRQFLRQFNQAIMLETGFYLNMFFYYTISS